MREALAKRTGRMAEYRRFVSGLRSEFVHVGLEVDLGAGGLLLAPEDAAGWDLLVGAIHGIAGRVEGLPSQQEAERLFLSELERLLAQPIDVLAHPFRFFRRANLTCPVHLFAHRRRSELSHGPTGSPLPARVRGTRRAARARHGCARPHGSR